MYVFLCSLYPKFTSSDNIAMLKEGKEDLIKTYFTRFKLASYRAISFGAVQKLDKEEDIKS